jgi:hypothetical protein
VKVPSDKSWSGWIGFAALLMMIIGAIDFFEGLIAVIRGHYYVVASSQVIVFDTTTWGWITMILGIILVLVGLGLAGGASWARWVSIFIVVFALIEQLSWLGSSQYTLWSLTVIALMVMVLFALTARWSSSSMEA